MCEKHVETTKIGGKPVDDNVYENLCGKLVFSPNRPCENLCGKLVENKALFWRSCVKNACAQRESKPRCTITLPEKRVKTT